jgi:hypothetical protein
VIYLAALERFRNLIAVFQARVKWVVFFMTRFEERFAVRESLGSSAERPPIMSRPYFLLRICKVCSE